MPCRRHVINRSTLKKIDLLITTIFKFENSPGCQSENREGYRTTFVLDFCRGISNFPSKSLDVFKITESSESINIIVKLGNGIFEVESTIVPKTFLFVI